MSYQQETIEIALTLYSCLSELLDSESSNYMQVRLKQYLCQFQRGVSTEDDIWELITSNRVTQNWATRASRTGLRQKSSSLPGNSSEVSAPTFKCPHCERKWQRDRAGRPTPFCSEHGVLLELVSKG